MATQTIIDVKSKIRDIKDFPKEGKSKLLYVADDGIYRWDSIEKCYLMSANFTKWDIIE